LNLVHRVDEITSVSRTVMPRSGMSLMARTPDSTPRRSTLRLPVMTVPTSTY
jgi:hypothetical protein